MTDKVRMRFEELKNANGILGVEPEETGHLEDPSFESRLLLNVSYRNCTKMWAEFVCAGELHEESKEDEMGGAGNTHGGDDKCIQSTRCDTYRLYFNK
jgi:hypothetical protein